MPQLLLPIFPEGTTLINREVGFTRQDGRITYFVHGAPIFQHDVQDRASLRLIISQLYLHGHAEQVQIAGAFGVTALSVKRAVKALREHGVEGFFQLRVGRGPAVLTAAVLAQAQQRLDERQSIAQVATALGLKVDTLRKAVRAGKLHRAPTEPAPSPTVAASTQSQRSATDSQAPLGVGATNLAERLMASLGALEGVPTRFEACTDVAKAGVLLALPAVLAMGLLRHQPKYFQLPKGYYTVVQVFLLLVFMALARIQAVDSLRYEPPGEWGKLLGLDRIPEVRTLRRKLKHLVTTSPVEAWSGQLGQEWMAADPLNLGVLYVDGHVRVYHGQAVNLPKHYVARERLCLRASADYWVNAMDGQPLFVVSPAVDAGLLAALRQTIVPRLLVEVPGQPSAEELATDPRLCRFTIGFDREGYSPDFFRDMGQLGVACLSYHKYPGPDWPEPEFVSREVRLAGGQVETMRLAQRRTVLSNGLEVREIRHLSQKGHQTAVLTTNEQLRMSSVAAGMFGRWSQENYLKYMRENFALDRMIEYGGEAVNGQTRVVNPERRRLDSQVRKVRGQLQRQQSAYGQVSLWGEIEPSVVQQYVERKEALRGEIQNLETQLVQLLEQRSQVDTHLKVEQLPVAEQVGRLRFKSKHFIDTIKMIAYRAETAMGETAREAMRPWQQDDARKLLREVYTMDADLAPDEAAGTLTVRLHYPANPVNAKVLAHLCQELTETETVFPGTKLRLIYQLVSAQNPACPSI